LRLRTALAALTVCACLAAAASAWAGETLSLHANFTPNTLGGPTNLSATALFSSTTGGPQSPATKVTAYGPAGMSIDTRGAGVCTATPAALEAAGPKACPPDSRIGFGSAVGLFEIANELIPGPFTLEFFLAPRQGEQLVILIYVNAVTPASEQLVLVAHEVRAPKPYGIGLDFDIPIVPTLPGASLGWVQHTSLTLGSTHLTYFRRIHGKRKLVHVRGIVTPKTCPHGGFPIEARVGFADGSTTTTTTAVPCPHK
jgi:hypothetical protein